MEEIADVLVMMIQMRKVFDIEVIDTLMDFKTDRKEKRMSEITEESKACIN